MAIRIIVDSSVEINSAEAKELGVEVIPLKSIFGDTEYLDGIDMTSEEFYEKLAASEELPTTSQPTPGEFEQLYRPMLDAGDDIVVITLSSKMSGTWQSAHIARESLNADDAARVRLVDSETVTLGMRVAVQRALDLREEGKTAAEIAETLEAEKRSIRLYAVVDTLEYLHKGGRLSATSAAVGTLLKVKPMIAVEDGETKNIGKVRGMKKGYEEVFNLVDKTNGIDFTRPIAIAYTGDRERFTEFQEIATEHLQGHDPLIVSIGSVIGTHVGPGAVAIAYFEKP